jgi:hypothetical protein
MRDKTMLKSAISHHLMGVGRMNLFRLGSKLRLGLLFLLGGGLFVACAKDPISEETPVVISEVPVVFSSELSDWSASRAANDSWGEGDQVGIYMFPHVEEASVAADFSIYADTVSNVPYLTSGSGKSGALAVVSGQKAIVFPADNGQVNFVAYYPYQAGTNTVNGHVYKVDVSKQSPAKAIDLLYHKGTGTAYSKTNKNVTLGFTHQLSKLKISLVSASDMEVDLTAVTLMGFPSTADFNLSTGVLSNLGGTATSITSVKDVASSVDGQAVFEAIVVPHARNSYTRNVIFEINNTNYGCWIPTSAAFKAGTVHSYNFKFTGTKVEPAQELVDFGDGGGAVFWGDYQLTTDKLSFDLPASRTTENTVTLSTNAPAALTYTLSGEADRNTNVPEWMTGVTLSNPTPDGNGGNNYILTFNTEHHINSEATPRTGYIRLEIAGITLPVRVNQAANGYDVYDPVPASFDNLPVVSLAGNTFTITTNDPDENITVATTNEELITNLTKERSEVAANGTFTWTIGFDVAANATNDARTGDVEVTISRQKKTVTVSQIGVSVHNPVPASFDNLAVGGLAGNTFTITTNAPDESITVTTTNEELITNLTKERSEVAADGTSTWTIGFDVAANKTIVDRSGSIEVTIGGITKTVSVSQIGISVYVNNPSTASFPDLAVGGLANNTFTITTNAPDEEITVTTTNPSLITNIIPSRSKVAANGTSTWTISFDVSANTTTNVRSGDIKVTIGGITKTVSISQIGVYVHDSDPASIDITSPNAASCTFTIETNAPVEEITVTDNASWITNLNAERSVKDAASGIYLWTVTFDVSAHLTPYPRSAVISITIGKVTKKVTVSQD